MEGIILALDDFCGKFRGSPKAYFMLYTAEPQLGNLRLLNTLGARIWHLSPSDASKSSKKR